MFYISVLNILSSDIDECRETPNICRGRDDVCTNLRGSYRCIPIECPYGYMRDRDRKK
jgi:fibulin 1/2